MLGRSAKLLMLALFALTGRLVSGLSDSRVDLLRFLLPGGLPLGLVDIEGGA